MDVLFVSDLHSEFYIDHGKKLVDSMAQADIISIAGDLGTSKTISYILPYICEKYPKVIYVLGNHDMWYTSFAEMSKKIEKLKEQYSNLYILDNERIFIQGQGFVGSTLWYIPNENKNQWPDFLYIKKANTIIQKHEVSKQFLKNNIKEGDIVITHMLPSYKCVSEKYKNNEWNCYFVGECEELIAKNKPKIWHSGHSHCQYNFLIHNTRMINNASGYPRENGVYFNQSLVVNI